MGTKELATESAESTESTEFNQGDGPQMNADKHRCFMVHLPLHGLMLTLIILMSLLRMQEASVFVINRNRDFYEDIATKAIPEILHQL